MDQIAAYNDCAEISEDIQDEEVERGNNRFLPTDTILKVPKGEIRVLKLKKQSAAPPTDKLCYAMYWETYNQSLKQADKILSPRMAFKKTHPSVKSINFER